MDAGSFIVGTLVAYLYVKGQCPGLRLPWEQTGAMNDWIAAQPTGGVEQRFEEPQIVIPSCVSGPC